MPILWQHDDHGEPEPAGILGTAAAVLALVAVLYALVTLAFTL